MTLKILYGAAITTVLTAMLDAGYAYSASDHRYAVIALMLAVQGMALVYRAIAHRSGGYDAGPGIGGAVLTPAALSLTGLAITGTAALWGWRSGLGEVGLLTTLVCVQAAFCAHHVRRRETRPAHIWRISDA